MLLLLIVKRRTVELTLGRRCYSGRPAGKVATNGRRNSLITASCIRETYKHSFAALMLLGKLCAEKISLIPLGRLVPLGEFVTQ